MPTLYPTDSQVLCECVKTNTIRVWPNNYVVAHHNGNYWVCDPDAAAPLVYVLLVQAALNRHEVEWSKPGDCKLLASVTGKDVEKKIECLKQAEIMELFLEGIGL